MGTLPRKLYQISEGDGRCGAAKHHCLHSAMWRSATKGAAGHGGPLNDRRARTPVSRSVGRDGAGCGVLTEESRQNSCGNRVLQTVPSDRSYIYGCDTDLWLTTWGPTKPGLRGPPRMCQDFPPFIAPLSATVPLEWQTHLVVPIFFKNGIQIISVLLYSISLGKFSC